MSQNQPYGFQQKEFQPQLSKTIAPANYRAADYSKGFDARDRWLRSGEDAFLRSLDRNADIASINAKKATLNNNGKDLQELVKFSKTAMEFVEDWRKKDDEAKEVGAIYDGLFTYDPQSPEGQQDEAIVEQVQNDAAEIADIDNQITEETGDPTMGRAARDRLEPQTYAVGMRNEATALTQASALYAPYMQNWVSNPNSRVVIDGKEMSVRDAIATGNPAYIQAALAAGRWSFLRDNGLQSASKAGVVKHLSGTIKQVDASLSSSLGAQAVKDLQDEAKSEVLGTTYVATQSADYSALGDLWRSAADRAYTSGAYRSRAEANEAITKQMVAALVAKGDVEGLKALRDIQKISGNEGTRLGNQYGALIDQGIQEAEQQANANLANGRKGVYEDMYKDLASAPDQAARDAVIEIAAGRLEQLGDWQGARELRGERDKLSIAGNNQLATARLSDGIKTGATTAQDIAEAVAKGAITPEQAQQLQDQLQQNGLQADPKNPIAKGTASRWGDRFETEFLTSLGFARDPITGTPGGVATKGVDI